MPTKIEWTDETWNPITGCSPISAGCANCYAQRMARRLAGRYGYPEAPHHFDVTLHPDRLDQPLKWRKPRRVFVCSMGDLFHEDVDFSWIAEIVDTIEATPEHTYQILTKRPSKLLEFTEWMHRENYDPSVGMMGFFEWPKNVWLGVTVCNQDETWKIAELLKIPAAVRFVSVEPMLEEIDLRKAFRQPATGDGYGLRAVRGLRIARSLMGPGGIDLVICGGETGPGARPMDLDWARSLRDQCQAAGVPFFFKRDSDGNRKLDGRLWEEMPR